MSKQKSTPNAPEATKTRARGARRVITYRIEVAKSDAPDTPQPLSFRDREVIVDSIRDARLIKSMLQEFMDEHKDSIFSVVKIIQQPKLSTPLED